MKRQQRKLNFLITQTELYAHFVARKMTGKTDKDRDQILSQLDKTPPTQQRCIDGTAVRDVILDDYGMYYFTEHVFMNLTKFVCWPVLFVCHCYFLLPDPNFACI